MESGDAHFFHVLSDQSYIVICEVSIQNLLPFLKTGLCYCYSGVGCIYLVTSPLSDGRPFSAKPWLTH